MRTSLLVLLVLLVATAATAATDPFMTDRHDDARFGSPALDLHALDLSAGDDHLVVELLLAGTPDPRSGKYVIQFRSDSTPTPDDDRLVCKSPPEVQDDLGRLDGLRCSFERTLAHHRVPGYASVAVVERTAVPFHIAGSSLIIDVDYATIGVAAGDRLSGISMHTYFCAAVCVDADDAETERTYVLG